MVDLTPEELVDVVASVAKVVVAEQKQTHPCDVMATVTTVAETIYHFIEHLPRR